MITLPKIAETLEPFAKAKVYNPNRSPLKTTRRTMNIRANDIEKLQKLYNEVVHLMSHYQ